MLGNLSKEVIFRVAVNSNIDLQTIIKFILNYTSKSINCTTGCQTCFGIKTHNHSCNIQNLANWTILSFR